MGGERLKGGKVGRMKVGRWKTGETWKTEKTRKPRKN